jgi:hypothetical protein
LREVVFQRFPGRPYKIPVSECTGVDFRVYSRGPPGAVMVIVFLEKISNCKDASRIRATHNYKAS